MNLKFKRKVAALRLSYMLINQQRMFRREFNEGMERQILIGAATPESRKALAEDTSGLYRIPLLDMLPDMDCGPLEYQEHKHTAPPVHTATAHFDRKDKN